MKTSSEIMFEVKEISKLYENKVALASLSLTIGKGELVAIIGPSGAGKTTLLNTLANVIKPDSGEVFIDDINAKKYSNSKSLAKKVGIIRQQYDLVGQLPVIHNVLAGRLADWSLAKSLLSLIFPQEKELAARALQKVGLLNKIFEKTSHLSGGEQQRVALARLLVQRPEAILADEPVASLDPARAEDILSLLTGLVKEEKQTLVTSLHSVEYAKKYFTRIIALKNGEIFFDLPTEKISEDDLEALYRIKEMKIHG